MLLRNKKTGEIKELPDGFFCGDNLKKICEEWEDAPEEPKEHYSITQFGEVIDEVDGYMSETIDEMKQIGNYFETKEEAEKAVERLRAWKRLKDKGFRFIDHIDRDSGQGMTRYEWDGYVNGEDLDLLFGGEE